MALFTFVSLAMCFYFSGHFLNGGKRIGKCHEKVFYARAIGIPFEILYHMVPIFAIILMHVNNYKKKKLS